MDRLDAMLDAGHFAFDTKADEIATLKQAGRRRANGD